MNKYFVSAIHPKRQLGAMQFEASSIDEAKEKAEKMCKQRANFRLYEVDEFDENMPIDEFVDVSKLRLLGY